MAGNQFTTPSGETISPLTTPELKKRAAERDLVILGSLLFLGLVLAACGAPPPPSSDGGIFVQGSTANQQASNFARGEAEDVNRDINMIRSIPGAAGELAHTIVYGPTPTVRPLTEIEQLEAEIRKYQEIIDSAKQPAPTSAATKKPVPRSQDFYKSVTDAAKQLEQATAKLKALKAKQGATPEPTKPKPQPPKP